MKHDKQFHHIIRQEIDAEFARLDVRPSLHSAVMSRIRGERSVRRKAPLALVLALLLALGTLTAVAIEVLTGRQIIEQLAVPMAQENDTEAYVQGSYTHEELVGLLRTLKENGITLEEDLRIMQALERGQGYWEEEVLMAICREAFGGSFSTWSIEEKYWFDSMTVSIGFKDANAYLLPGEDDMTLAEAKAHAAKLLADEYGVSLPTEDDERWRIFEWLYAPWTDESGLHPARWTFEFVNPRSNSVEYTARFSLDGGDAQLDRAYFLEGSIHADTYDQLDRYMCDKYGPMPYWPLSAWAEFGRLLQDITPTTRNQWCWQHAGYREPPDGALSSDEAVAIARSAIPTPGTTDAFVICCDAGERVLYKVTLSIWSPGNEGAAAYDEIWCVEMDCLTGDVTGTQRYEYGQSILPMYVPFAVIGQAPVSPLMLTAAPTARNAEKERQAEAYDHYQQLHGANWHFWPLAAQKEALGGHNDVPQAGEMSREAAVETALAAVRQQVGAEALDNLGAYQVGAILCRYEEPDGPRLVWELCITSDPETVSNGYRVRFELPAGQQAPTEILVERANAGNG